jgi:glycosyltransferase involved in cell wall biosynthesis
MACGTPCIATAVGGIPEVIGNVGILVPPRSPEKIAQAAIEILGNKKIRSELSQKARKRVEKVFDWNIIAKKVEKCYENYFA